MPPATRLFADVVCSTDAATDWQLVESSDDLVQLKAFAKRYNVSVRRGQTCAQIIRKQIHAVMETMGVVGDAALAEFSALQESGAELQKQSCAIDATAPSI